MHCFTSHRTIIFVITNTKILNFVYLQYFTVSNELSQIKSSNCPTVKGMIGLRSIDINHIYRLKINCFYMFHHLYIKQIQKYINNQQIYFNVYDVFYSQFSHQHVSAGIPAIFRVILLQEYKVLMQLSVPPSLQNN
jgi:hypothetical protein